MLSAKAYIFFLITLLLSSASSLVKAQADPRISERGNFTINYIKGCAPLEVEMQERGVRENGDKIYFYLKLEGERIEPNHGPLPPTPFTFELNKPGIYYVYQWKENTINNSGVEDSIRVEVLESEEPVFETFNCGARNVAVKVRPEGFYDYYVAKKSPTDPEIRLDHSNHYTNYLDFASSGVQNVIVEGRFNSSFDEVFHGDCGRSNKEVVVLEGLPEPRLEQLKADLQNGSVSVRYTVPQSSFQILEARRGGTGNFTPVDTLNPESGEVSISNPAINNQFFCYRITTYNLCSGTKLHSNIFCTADLKEAPFTNGNQLNYRTASTNDLENITLIKEGQEIHSFGNAVIGSFQDIEVNCNTTYSYSLQITYEGGASITQNRQIKTKLESILQQPENIISFWENSFPVFSIPLPYPPEGARYFAYKGSANTGNMVAQSEANKIISPSSGKNACYFYNYLDACGNESAPSPEVCALYLTNSSTQPDVLEFNWNQYNGYQEGVAYYRLEKLNNKGDFIELVYEGPGTSINLGEQDLEESGNTFIVKAIPLNSNLEVSSSNPYVFQIVMEAYFPNAFTPDGDGKNDQFKAEGKFVSSCTLEIFNSWGELIYKTEDKELGWDGTSRGSIAAQGTYLFKALIKTVDGKEKSKKGTVILLRR